MLKRSVFATLMFTFLIGFLVACSSGGEPRVDTLETTTETRGDTGGDDTGGDDTGGDDTGGDDTGGDDTGGDDTGGDDTGGDDTGGDDTGGDETGGGDEPGVTKSILELAAANEDLSTLVSAVGQAGLADALDEESEGGLTVFAPTNDAFEALDALPEGDALKEVLTYHVAAGTLSADQLTDKDSVETLNGDDISVEVVDGEVVLNGTVKVIQADIEASNGVIHVIDAVLLPDGGAH